ncbi:hypothetical protein MHJ25_15555 [Acinetobacter baumannii]|uniref:hypothetical protein n=1 Tax=Acinetobacter baumannii TaxID=470 RepID=UPI000AF1F362|nr:hypothetical protein [Acinetobacter baumannii]MCG9254930.1 hypothetical protein [Acinetobacter baumannii]TDH87165.1 hypothetical protein DWA19_17060 [Acinetobacter baumannii]THD98382.1 hypothetical protein E5F90_05770 [Acinetobacter baumannii]HAV4298264.1 hypothetical protein [Acinetobacter baumannii]HCQ9729845.1 hypothetical protein [Acinetobacter baumannii]
MIDYSPHTKYTAQKIQDKVTRGAYFYSSFSIDDGIGSTTNIKKLIEKLTIRYDLNLTSRQRNYRLKTGKPIADLIVQDVIYENRWQFILLITTPNSHKHSKQPVHPTEQYKQIGKDKIYEMEELSFTRENIIAETDLVHDYFRDDEVLKFVMSKPYLELDFAGCSAELVRMTHKKYKSNSDKFYKTPSKPFSWTWRWKKEFIAKKKTDLVSIINRYISQTNKTKTIEDLVKWQSYFQTYAVFRGMRQQVGRLYTLGKLFLYSRCKQRWDDQELPTLKLYFAQRYETYADSYEEYCLRREIYINYDIELPRELAQNCEWNEIDHFLNATGCF